MEDNNSKTKNNASQFFGEHRLAPVVPDVLQDNLKQELFQEYLNYYAQKNMKSSSSSLLKRLALGTAVVAVLSLFTLGGYAFSLSQNQTQTPPPQDQAQDPTLGAELAYVEGDLEIEAANGWNDLAKDAEIKEGMSLRVAGTGKVIINLDDGSAIRIADNSSVTLTSLDPENIVVTNNSGNIYTRVAKADREFTVAVAEVNFESLGTAYKTINTDDKKGVEVYQSKVDAKLTDKKVTVDQGKGYYFVDKKAPKNVDKVVSLNVTTLKSDKFVVWNKEEDKKEYSKELGFLSELDKKTVAPTPTKTTTPTKTVTKTEPKPVSSADVSLSLVSKGGTKVGWTVTGTTTEGFKLVWSKNQNPAYPPRVEDFANYYENDKRVGDLSWGSNDGPGTYYVKVCQYKNGGCGAYSNQITVVIP